MGKRIHWAFDGTLIWRMTGAWARTALTATEKSIADADASLNSEVNLDPDDYLLFNFPSPVAIDQVGLKMGNATANIVFAVSSDSTNGQDGTWDEVLTESLTTANVLQFFSPTATPATWLRIFFPATTTRVKSCQLFGEYQAPRFEFWNAAGTAELTDNYPLAMASAPNLDDYFGNAQFKLKNTDSVPHDYSLTIKTVRYGGDTVIADNYKLSVDGGTTKLQTVVVAGIDPGELSGVIDVYGEVVKANNPADGYHYFVVDVTETA